MRAAVVAFLVSAVALAGCTSDSDDGEVPTSADCLERGLILNATGPQGPRCEEPPFVVRHFEDPDHHCVVTKQRDRVHAPDLVGNPWAIGQSWDFAVAIDGEDLGVTKMVYYEDQDFDSEGTAQHYLVGASSRDDALRKAVLSDNPMLGRVHRILYSPHETGDHADMFHFPLCEGSSWTTTFYGEQFKLTAREAPLRLPQGSDEGFLIEGTSSEGSTLRLSYSPRAQWFTFIDLDRGDGSSVEMQLEGMETSYTGPVYFLRGQQDHHVSVDVALPALPALPGVPQLPGFAGSTFVREDGANGPYDSVGIHVDVQLHGEGQAVLEVVGPDGETVHTVTLDSLQGAIDHTGMLEVPFSAGEWSLQWRGVGLDATAGEPGSVTGEVRFTSIYDVSGEV